MHKTIAISLILIALSTYNVALAQSTRGQRINPAQNATTRVNTRGVRVNIIIVKCHESVFKKERRRLYRNLELTRRLLPTNHKHFSPQNRKKATNHIKDAEKSIDLNIRCLQTKRGITNIHTREIHEQLRNMRTKLKEHVRRLDSTYNYNAGSGRKYGKLRRWVTNRTKALDQLNKMPVKQKK